MQRKKTISLKLNKMKKKTSQKILDHITKTSGASGTAPHELVDFLDISERAVFKQLKNLYEAGEIDKVGRPPKVFYLPKKKKKTTSLRYKLPSKLKKLIDDNYLIVTSGGEKKSGLDGFVYWSQKQNLPVEKTALEYEKTFKKHSLYKKAGFIDGTYKLKNTFAEIFVNKLYYLDFCSIEPFGKTKMGWLLFYAKQGQDRKLIKELVAIFKDKVRDLIKKYKIEAVGFIPPTIKREVQLMREMERMLALKLPKVSIKKAQTPVAVVQQTLFKLKDRIENARRTIFMDETKIYGNILLIDDAVGSGATMNETARKIRERKICQGKIYGLAIVGSFKGFAVISEI